MLPNAEPRLTKQPVEIGGFDIRPGVALLASAYLVHHDPDIYPEPYAFRPERFLERPAGHLHVDPVRRRPPALPRRELRAAGDEDRAAGRAARYELCAASDKPEPTGRRSITFSPYGAPPWSCTTASPHSHLPPQRRRPPH